MFSTVRWRLIWIALIAVMCGWALLPKEDENGNAVSPLNLGLDLQGGMHLAVEIDESAAPPDADLDDAIERTVTTLRNRIDQFGVREPNIQRAGDRIIVELAGLDDPERAVALVNQTAHMEFSIVTDGQSFVDQLARIDRAIVNAVGAEALTPTPLETAVDLGDVLGTTADSAAADSLTTAADTAQAAAAEDPQDAAADTTADVPVQTPPGSDLRPLTAALGVGRIPGEYLIAQQDTPNVRAWLEIPEVQDLFPRDVTVNWGVEQIGTAGNTYIPIYVLEADPLITGAELADAGPANRDPTFNQPIVPFETTRRGARLFERGTARNVGNNMAIVLDEKVQSYAVIRSVLSRRAQIELSPGTSFQEAQDLALVLRAGALPLPVQIAERRQVGASLGEDSIRQGRTAFTVGIVAVLALMVIYYKASGILAVCALAFYVLLMMGGLAGLGATLTLPGIAGLILSIGMAVDANVLIFERIREELEAGKTARTAVEAGFANALSAIVDANLTTLITGMILFQFGTGPVQGFAVTLCIGILASFFSAVYVTRTFYMIYLDRRSATESVSI
ncbi:MAG: protein translocase subunit SecD [Gemmatimonadota bacterium]|nr:protein translocase subunit SecD [Gemmatimonadota bacterium]